MAEHIARRIRVLRESVARKIAAGEVIDRPLSVIRELVDNSLDAGCTKIEVHLEAGGIQSIQVVDDGSGMSEADLELCWLAHTTSKIESEEDLNSLTSLGFRGEALSSVAACSRLTITSCVDDSGMAHRLTVSEGHAPQVKKTSGVKGTRVQVDELFYNIPARKKFLKSSASEGTLCRRALEEKALAFPNVAFVLKMDRIVKLSLPVQSLEDRCTALMGHPWSPESVFPFSAEGEGFRIEGFALSPNHYRSDRKGIRIYANRRPLQEFALVQAVTYAFDGFLPGGAYPNAIVFLDVDPQLVDFNIHPAKREARFRNLPQIHQTLVHAIRDRLNLDKLRSPLFQTASVNEQFAFESHAGSQAIATHGRAKLPSVTTWDPQPNAREEFWSAWERVQESPLPRTERPNADTNSPSFRYLGQVLGVFLVVEVADTLYLVDQHAAHERILFDRFRSQRGKTQELLIPVRFEVEAEVAEFLSAQRTAYEDLGIGFRSISGSEFELFRLPQLVASMEKDVVEYLKDCRKPPQDIEKDLYASLSCRAAVMDGDPLDPIAAKDLIQKAFQLDNARCPHGRPIWTTLSREELFSRVSRTL